MGSIRIFFGLSHAPWQSADLLRGPAWMAFPGNVFLPIQRLVTV
jgi:hypothetical protein